MHSESTVEQKKSQDIKPILKLRQVMWSTWPRTLGTGAPGLSLIRSALLRNLNKICALVPFPVILTFTATIFAKPIQVTSTEQAHISYQITKHMKTQFVSIYLLKFLLAGSKLFTQFSTFFFKSTPYFLELCCFTFFISQVFFFQNLEEK